MNTVLELAVPTALPSLMVLVGILLNQRSSDRLDARITTLESSLRGEIQSLRGEMQGLWGEMLAVRGEVNAASARFHSDIIMLVQRDADKDNRIVRLEEKS